MNGPCPFSCANKTEFGYCKTTVCLYAPTIRVTSTPRTNADRVMDAFHFNQVKDETVAGMTVYPSRKDHKRRPISNADRIRAMTDEELAEWIDARCPDCPPGVDPATPWSGDVCAECWLEWLKKEATE